VGVTPSFFPAVTGLGSLNYGKAEAYLINMFENRAKK
jgi:hypothetical protein